jgi:hypothetical protein
MEPNDRINYELPTEGLCLCGHWGYDHEGQCEQQINHTGPFVRCSCPGFQFDEVGTKFFAPVGEYININQAQQRTKFSKLIRTISNQVKHLFIS